MPTSPRSLALAEALLTRVVGPEPAAALIGDLLEANLKPLQPRLWLTVARILFAHTWRIPAAFLTAGLLSTRLFALLQHSLFGPAISSPYSTPLVTLDALTLLSLIHSILTFAALYLLLRQGRASAFTQLTGVSALLATLIILFWWNTPTLLLLLAILLIGLPLWTLRARATRAKAYLAMLATVTAGLLAATVSFFATDRYRQYLVQGPLSGRDWQLHPTLIWLEYLTLFLTLVTIALTAQHTSRWADPETLPTHR